MHTFVNIMNFNIPSYGLAIIIGVITTNMVALAFLKGSNLDRNDFIILEAYTFLGAFLGAKILYLWVERYRIDWTRILEFDYFNGLMQGGFVFYGGLIGGLLSVFAAGRIHKIDAAGYVRRFIFLIPYIHSFGRIGCFFAGCCYGIPYEGAFAVTFPPDSLAPGGVKLFPVQLVEAFFLMVLAAVILLLQLTKNIKYTTELYLTAYAVLRFVLEYFRYDEARGTFLMFYTSQWISIGLVLGVLLVSGFRIRNRNCKKNL